jgi:hypothetical protein
VEAPEVKRRLAASIGTWNSGVAVLDGVREVLLTLSAGAAWISTGNLAAPYVGSLLTQVRGARGDGGGWVQWWIGLLYCAVIQGP